jgi:hypothetical protein
MSNDTEVTATTTYFPHNLCWGFSGFYRSIDGLPMGCVQLLPSYIMSNSLLYGCWCLHFPSSASSSSSLVASIQEEKLLWFLVSSNVEKSTDSNVNPTIQRTMMTWHGLEMWREMDEMWREREDEGRTDEFSSFFFLTESVWSSSVVPSQRTDDGLTKDRQILFFLTESVWPSCVVPSQRQRTG